MYKSCRHGRISNSRQRLIVLKYTPNVFILSLNESKNIHQTYIN